MIQKTTWFGLIAVWLIAMQPAVAAPPQLTDYSLKTETLTPKSGAVKRAVIVLHASEGHSEYMRHIASTLRESLPDTVFLIPNGPFPSDTKERYHWFSEPSKKGAQDGAQALNRYIGEVKNAVVAIRRADRCGRLECRRHDRAIHGTAPRPADGSDRGFCCYIGRANAAR